MKLWSRCQAWAGRNKIAQEVGTLPLKWLFLPPVASVIVARGEKVVQMWRFRHLESGEGRVVEGEGESRLLYRRMSRLATRWCSLIKVAILITILDRKWERIKVRAARKFSSSACVGRRCSEAVLTRVHRYCSFQCQGNRIQDSSPSVHSPDSTREARSIGRVSFRIPDLYNGRTCSTSTRAQWKWSSKGDYSDNQITRHR